VVLVVCFKSFKCNTTGHFFGRQIHSSGVNTFYQRAGNKVTRVETKFPLNQTSDRLENRLNECNAWVKSSRKEWGMQLAPQIDKDRASGVEIRARSQDEVGRGHSRPCGNRGSVPACHSSTFYLSGALSVNNSDQTQKASWTRSYRSFRLPLANPIRNYSKGSTRCARFAGAKNGSGPNSTTLTIFPHSTLKKEIALAVCTTSVTVTSVTASESAATSRLIVNLQDRAPDTPCSCEQSVLRL
jgi:hypothetical protein